MSNPPTNPPQGYPQPSAPYQPAGAPASQKDGYPPPQQACSSLPNQPYALLVSPGTPLTMRRACRALQGYYPQQHQYPPYQGQPQGYPQQPGGPPVNINIQTQPAPQQGYQPGYPPQGGAPPGYGYPQPGAYPPPGGYPQPGGYPAAPYYPPQPYGAAPLAKPLSSWCCCPSPLTTPVARPCFSMPAKEPCSRCPCRNTLHSALQRLRMQWQGVHSLLHDAGHLRSPNQGLYRVDAQGTRPAGCLPAD